MMSAASSFSNRQRSTSVIVPFEHPVISARDANLAAFAAYAAGPPPWPA